MTGMDNQLARVVALIAQQPAGPDGGDGVASFLRRLCGAVVPALAASGAGLSVMADDEVRGLTTASDPAAERIEDLQFVLGEGPCIDAFATRRPVLVPDLGAMRDQQAAFGAAWVRLYAGDLTGEELAEACRWARATSRLPPDLGTLDWTSLALKTRTIYETLCSFRQVAASAVAGTEPVVRSSGQKRNMRSPQGSMPPTSGRDGAPR